MRQRAEELYDEAMIASDAAHYTDDDDRRPGLERRRNRLTDLAFAYELGSEVPA